MNQDTVINSLGETRRDLSILEFLLQPKENTIRIFYDLDYSIIHIKKHLELSEREAITLTETTKLRILPYHIRYVPGKLFSIKRTNAFAYYTNSQQYYPKATTHLNFKPLFLAEEAQKIGEDVYGVLQELGLETTSLVNPAKSYEEKQLEELYKQLEDRSIVKARIIDCIGLNIFGREWEKFLEEKRGTIRKG